MRRRVVLWILFVAISAPVSAADDPVFDVAALASTPLRPRILKRVESRGLVTEELRFHSETDGKKDVDIFAFFSYPQRAKGRPAYIWNPGGLGQASRAYTEAGASRGYATLCIDFPLPGYRSTGNYPINTGLELGDDPRQAPIYHGAVALLKAVSYLESRPEVDKDRIGMAGASWGGFFTTLMVGIDPRLKVGSCLYGCGGLELGNMWWDGAAHGNKPVVTPAQRKRWRTSLDPAWRLAERKTPIAWISGTNDRFYLMPALMKSYERAAGERNLTLVPNWDHALPVRLDDELVIAWLDAHLQHQAAFPVVTPISVKNENGRLIAEWTFQGDATAADLIVSFGDDGNWVCRYWHTLKAEMDERICRVRLPATAVPCFISGAVTDQHGFRTSTPLARVDAAALGVKVSPSIPDYDGCREWGSFEAGQLGYLVRHDRSGQKRWIPRLSLDAKEGEHSAILDAGRTDLPPILYTAGVPHRFVCYLKALQPAPVEVQLKLADLQKTVAVNGEWQRVELDLTPPNTLMGLFPASITIPAGTVVQVDDISFRPVNSGRRSTR